MEQRDLQVLGWRLFEESNDAVFILNCTNETIQQANPAAQRLTGLPWRQLRDRSLAELIRGDRPDLMSALRTAIRDTGYFHSEEEYEIRSGPSGWLPVNISVSRLHVPTGPLGLIVARDISERKLAQRRLGEFNTELQRRVDQQTAELRAANKQLSKEMDDRKATQEELERTNRRLRRAIRQLERAAEQAIRRERLHAMEQITGGVAHDINNSLTSLGAFSELVLRQAQGELTRQWVEGIQTAASDIAGIVQRLRQFHGDQREAAESEMIDVVQLVEGVVQLTRPKWRDESLRHNKDIHVSVKAEGSPCLVGDASGLRAVLTNLIFNAVDASGPVGHIEARITQNSDHVVLEIADDGMGMTDDEQRRCFEPFFTTKADGTGLGLSVCHGIVKGCGGRIEIDSTLGRGTTIRLLLPKLDAQVSSTTVESLDVERTGTSAPTEGQGRLDGIKVLCVDDNQAVRSSMSALLSMTGAVVETAVDGPEGIMRCRQREYDAVITDFSMPGMDGLQLTSKLKREHPTLPIVLISGWTSLRPPEAVTSLQPDGVLTKPLSVDQLTSMLLSLVKTDAPAIQP